MLCLLVLLWSSKMPSVKSQHLEGGVGDGRIKWSYRDPQREDSVCGQDSATWFKTRSISRFSSLSPCKPEERMLNFWHSSLKKLLMSVQTEKLAAEYKCAQNWPKACLTWSSDSYGDKVSEIKWEWVLTLELFLILNLGYSSNKLTETLLQKA